MALSHYSRRKRKRFGWLSLRENCPFSAIKEIVAPTLPVCDVRKRLALLGPLPKTDAASIRLRRAGPRDQVHTVGTSLSRIGESRQKSSLLKMSVRRPAGEPSPSHGAQNFTGCDVRQVPVVRDDWLYAASR
jgi:hypothetical protein